MSGIRSILLVLSVFMIIELVCSKSRNYDNFDIEVVLSNPVRSKKFFECVRNDTTCSTEDKEMKHDLAEMITTSCAGCTDIERTKLKDLKRRAMDDPKILNLALGDLV